MTTLSGTMTILQLIAAVTAAMSNVPIKVLFLVTLTLLSVGNYAGNT